MRKKNASESHTNSPLTFPGFLWLDESQFQVAKAPVGATISRSVPLGHQRIGLCEKAAAETSPVCEKETFALREAEDKTDVVEDRRKSQHLSPRSCFHFVFTGGKEDLGPRRWESQVSYHAAESDGLSQVSPHHHPLAP